MGPKKSKVRIYHHGEHPEMMKLEINKLGRPYHKIQKIFLDKHDHFDGKLNIYFLKKFRVNISLKSLHFEMDVWHKQAQIFSSEIGSLAIIIDRPLLLNVLHDYYGLSKDTQVISTQQTPVTRTEERLKSKLAQELAMLITDDSLFGSPLQINPDYASLNTNWSYRIEFALDGYDGTFSLLLDSAHVDRLLATLRQNTEHSARPGMEQSASTQTSFMALPVRLTGHLATVSLKVADLMQLKSGDILPISLADRVPLFIGRQPLMTAVIAEDHGKLFFSGFTDPNSEQTHD